MLTDITVRCQFDIGNPGCQKITIKIYRKCLTVYMQFCRYIILKYELGISKTLQWEKHLASWFIPRSV